MIAGKPDLSHVRRSRPHDSDHHQAKSRELNQRLRAVDIRFNVASIGYTYSSVATLSSYLAWINLKIPQVVFF